VSAPPPPRPYPLAQQIPDDQPFVVRHSRRKRFTMAGSIVLALELFIGCLLGLSTLGGDKGGPGPSWGGLLAGFGVITVLLVTCFAGLMLFLTGGGPVLAVGPDGLWIRSRPSRGQAIWLPWSAIGIISRRRYGLERMLVVRPRDRRTDENLGLLTALDSSIIRTFYVNGFTATLNMADRREDEILLAVAYYSANRVPLA
jgi:hypothetical protein